MNSEEEQHRVLVSSEKYVFPPLRGTKMDERKSKIFRQVLAGVSGSLPVLALGFHGGWASPALAKLLSVDSDIPVTSFSCAWIVGFMFVGMLISALLIPCLLDKLGRKGLLRVSCVPQIGGCLLMMFAQNYAWYYAARLIIGLGLGVALPTVATYLGEISEDRTRAGLGSLVNNSVNLGVIIAYCSGPWVSRQVFIGIGASIALGFGVILFWIPESPYFSTMKNNREEARRSLVWLRGTEDVDEELKVVERNVEYDQANAGTFKELFVTPENRRVRVHALIVATGVSFAQELTGIVAIVAYSSLIFQASGSEISNNLCLVIVSLIQLITGYVASFTADLTGRRTMLLFSTIAVFVCLSTEAIYFQLKDAGVDVSSVYWLPLTVFVVFFVTYTIGLGILPPCIFGEVFPCNVKAKAMMIYYTATILSTLLVTQVYQLVADAYGIQYSFWLFAGFTFVSSMFVYFFVPETKNRSLRDIQDDFRRIARSKTKPCTLESKIVDG